MPNEFVIPPKVDRLNTFYKIINKEGQSIRFECNWAQKEMLENMKHRNLILKCRQIGSTTFWCIYLLDMCLFAKNLSCGIIAHSLSASQDIFKRIIKHAVENIPWQIKNGVHVVADSAHEIRFSNNSSIRVDTTMRSGTLTGGLLVSEFGKICARTPDKAKEIITGSVNAVPTNGLIVIESTAEGREGPFFDYWKQYEGKPVNSKLDYKTFFFPWWMEPSYKDDSPIEISKENEEYFSRLKEKGIRLSDHKKYWYIRKEQQNSDNIKQEFPSTPEEAWEGSHEGFYYAKHISKLRSQGRICNVPYQECSLVHTAWDIGIHDHTSIWFFQTPRGGEIQIIDYYENANEGLIHYADYLKKLGYIYGSHILPHDARNKSPITGSSYQEAFQNLIKGDVIVLELDEIFNGIQAVRGMIGQCMFDSRKCSEGIKRLENYKKMWDERLGCYQNRPLHDASSHGADAFRALALGIQHTSSENSQVTSNWIKNTRKKLGYK